MLQALPWTAGGKGSWPTARWASRLRHGWTATPTFAKVSALEELLLGARKEQIADAVASMGYGIGDLDK
ncbi:MAG: hypothetical protein ABIS84_01665 [Arachnia sp.]